MSPPSVICRIVRPLVLKEAEKIMIRAVLADKGSLFITLLLFIYPLTVQPFVERSAMVENTVYDDLDISLVRLFDK